MKTHYIIILLSSLACFSCSSNKGGEISPTKIPLVKPSAEEVNIGKFLSRDPKAYIYYFAQTDHKFGIISSQDSPSDPPCVFAYVDSNSMEAPSTKTVRANDVNMTINGVSLNSDYPTKSKEGLEIKSLFGQVVSFGVDVQTKSVSEESQLYVPSIITIHSPYIDKENGQLPLCDVSNFILKWNEDTMNDNGVIVQIEWGGVVLFGGQRDDSHVSISKIFPDTGQAKLDAEMFEGIPDTALCFLTVLRGNVDAMIVDGQSYKIGGATHETMQLVLIRNTKRI